MYQTKPSDILHIKNHWLAWQFDRAVMFYGRTVENRLHEKRKNGKPKYKLEEALGYSKQEALRMQLEKSRAEGRALRRQLGLIE